ncbi:MAG: DinB family protein [Acidobacteria bacterium]|nr:DinB family protein [Acidobacteriota bacterium]
MTPQNLEAVLASLERAPSLVREMVEEMPVEWRKKRRRPEKWSLHEHACHLAVAQELFEQRLDRMLAEDNPVLRPYLPHEDDAPDRLLAMNLEAALVEFDARRKRLVERLRRLTPAQWQRPARHAEYARYNVYIMFRHLALHDMLHLYRMEELLLEPSFFSTRAT